MQSPDDVCGVLNVAALLEALEGNGSDVVIAVETADDDKGRISVALEFLELADGIINAAFGSLFSGGDDLKIIEADDGGFGFIGAKGFEQGK